MRTCRAPGCTGRTTPYGVYCNAHKTRAKRHGAVGQEAITKLALEPYRARVRAKVETNAHSPLWTILEARWEGVVETARRTMATYLSGRPMSRYERMEAAEVVKLAENVSCKEITETTAAMFLMADREPRRFASDRAFRTQLVRRVRGLSEVNAGTWFDHRTGKVKRVYRDLPVKTTLLFAQRLVEAFGGVGVRMVHLEQERLSVSQEMARTYREAMEELR